MEILPSMRYLPRRTTLCFFFICVMFLACAFYTFLTDSKTSAAPTYNFIDFKDDIVSKSPTFQGDVIHTRSIPHASSASAASSSKLPTALSKSSVQTNKQYEVVTTKYIYLRNFTSSTRSSSTSSVPATTVPPNSNTCSLAPKENSKLILLWTSFFENWEYITDEHIRKCSKCRNCRVTKDRSKLLESDAVIFHARDMSIVDMPSIRLPHQRWVFYCLESPPYSDFPGLQYAQNMFNWTMTYRSDSDIPSPYGYTFRIRPSRKLDLPYLEWAWSNKSRSVVWMSSHCPTHGGRDAFAEELSKYIDVDIYGTCGTHICPPGDTDRCLQEFAQKYKFFLAFENSLCKDYITEKFYRTLEYNIVPVVFGSTKYDKFAPPGSYVDALSFKSPKHLAFFLKGVGKNFKLYSSFFKWRKDYDVRRGNTKECQLCSMLHRSDMKPSSYPNLREWWVKGSKCKTWEPK